MITIAPRTPAWAATVWPRCLEGLDPVATYGPEVLDTPTHPGDRYWAIVESQVRELGQVADEGDVAGGLGAGALDEDVEMGMAWASRWENKFSWTYGLAFFPEHRGQAKGQGYEVGNGITQYLFEKEDASAVLTMAYSTNPNALKYNGLQAGWKWVGRAHRRFVGKIEDAAGPGVHLFLFQTTRRLWEQREELERRRRARSEIHKRYRKKHPERRQRFLRRWELAQRGLTEEEYEAMVAAQGGVCVLCGRPPGRNNRADNRLNVDHDHETGARRGLICNSCNLTLGKVRDDPGLLRNMAAYIEKWRGAPAAEAPLPAIHSEDCSVAQDTGNSRFPAGTRDS